MNDPKKAPNSSEQFRRECEARHALSMPDDKRQTHYQGVKDKRGQKAVDYLIEEVKRQRKLLSKELEI